jgi:hypothetical protein
MLQLLLKMSGKRNETLVNGLRQLADQLERGIESDDPYIYDVKSSARKRIDGIFEIAEITGEPISYGYFGLTEDGKTDVLNSGYPAASYCAASASKEALDIKASGNPQGYVRLGIMDNEGCILPEYEDSSILKINQ